METSDSPEKQVWYLSLLDNFRIPRPQPTPSVRDFEDSWNVPASMKSRPRQGMPQSSNLNRDDNFEPSQNYPHGRRNSRRSDEIYILPASRKQGCNKMWLILIIPLVLLLLAGIGVLLYFGLCYWGWSSLSCGNNSASKNDSLASTTPIASLCKMKCLNGGTCDILVDPPRCHCPPGIKTLDCSCNDVSACCGDKTIYVDKNNYTLEKLFQSSTGFSSGYCQWEIITNSTNGYGGYLNMTIVNVDFLPTSSCEDNFVQFYNSSDVQNDQNLIAKICQSNQNTYYFSMFSSPSYTVNWTISAPDQNLYLTFAEQDFDYCENAPCNSTGATCQSQNLSYFCNCPPDEMGGGPGTPCRESNICEMFPTICPNGETCIPDVPNNYKCQSSKVHMHSYHV